MTLSQFADIADLLAALGIMLTIVFLALEIRKSSRQEKIANWQTTISGIREARRRTDDPIVADIVVRGRKSFNELSEPEQVTFGFWMEDMILAHDPYLVHPDQIMVAREETLKATEGAFREYFVHKGSQEWWNQSYVKKRWPQHLTSRINSAIQEVSRTHA